VTVPAIRGGGAALRRLLSFRGRTTRRDFIVFYMATGIAAAVPASMFRAVLPASVIIVIEAAMMILLIPTCVRRLHDGGWGGWWLLVSLPPLAAGLRDQYFRLRDPFAMPAGHWLPWTVQVPALLCGFALVLLLLWNDDEGPNRYGPNPRFDEAGVPI
jgi:uncharacterized membrane protein YhaH (DUF805 family)